MNILNEFSKTFSKEELEEIEVFKEGTEAMSVEGKEIICFQLLYQLINGNIKISEVSKDKLLLTYAQLKGFKEISGSIEIFDTSLLESIVSKAKKIISEEIEKRKQKR